MAKLKAFAAHDSKLNVWHPPMFLMHTGQAERTWIEIANEPNSLIGKHPEDFALYQVGVFDDSDGSLTAITPPVQTMSALQARRKPDQPDLPLQAVR